MLINDRYTLGEVIGSGGMSEVYAAEDSALGRSVAVKMLRPEMARDVNFRERFRREAQNSGKLNHPNVVSVFDTGEDEIDGLSIPYIVMERIHGRTLRDIVREDGPMPVDEAAEILRPVAEALQASHEAGIIHRDVKPANIMLTNTGQVKVMDFGIARALDDSTSAMTQTSAVIGTAQYLSPEQARGKAADARSDVYALGCVLYEAVTGRTPFEGETPFAVAYQHVQEEPVPPSEYIDDDQLSPTGRVNIDAVVLTAMAKHPADRYQSAYEMSEDLGRLSRGSVTEAARTHVIPASGAAVGEETHVDDAYPATSTLPPQGAVGGAAVAAAGVGAGVANAAVGEPGGAHRAPVESNRPDPDDDDESASGWLKGLAVLIAAALIALIGFFAWDYWQSNQDEQQQAEQAANMVTIPEVEDRPRAEVVSELEELGLQVNVNEEAHPDIVRGNAIRINPAAGSQLQKNSSVTLTVSSGKEIVDVPDITGLTLEEAADALNNVDLELDPQIEERASDSVPEGEIISQSPSGGTQLSKGSQVQVVVSTGQDMVEVPSLSGMDYDQAESTLRALGLRPMPEWVDSTEPQSRVLSVENSGTEVARDSEVRVQISNGMLIEAPDLVKQSEQGALDALAEAGWTGSASDLQVGTPIPTGAAVDNGRIGWASVNPGDQIRKDATIEVRYWEFTVDSLLPGN